MAELKILGAKRVEALMDVLKRKEQEAIVALIIPSYSDITAMVDAEFGLTSERAKIDDLKAQLKDAIEALNAITGESDYVDIRSNSRYDRKTAWDKRYDELSEQLRNKPLAELKRSFAEKKTQLWLCDTIEAAKAIVGIA